MEPTGFDWAMLWVSAVGSGGTIIALGVAVILGLRESHAVRRENEQRDTERRKVEAERRTAEQRRRRAQADCVSAQLKVDAVRTVNRVRAGELGIGYYASVDVHNASALPIYDVAVTVHPDGPGDARTGRVGFVPGGQRGHVHAPSFPDTTQDGDPVEVLFKDAAGVRWHRLADGDLHECSEHGSSE